MGRKYILAHEKWAHPKSVPCCLSSNLRTCTMRDFAFGGLSNHIMLAKFILKNSTVLETMSIWCFRKKYKIERQLTSCSRASATCLLSIYDNFQYYYVSSSSFSIPSFVSLVATMSWLDLLALWTLCCYVGHCKLCLVTQIKKKISLIDLAFYLLDLFEDFVYWH